NLAAVHEAVPARSAARLQTENRAGHDVPAVEHDKAVHRAYELRVTIAPAHHFGNRQGLQRCLDLAGERLGERHAWSAHLCDPDFTLGSLSFLQGFDADAVFLCEPVHGLLGRADRWTLDLALVVRRTVAHAFDQDCKTPRSRER